MIKPAEKTMAAAIKTWQFIRKPTTPVHLAFGLTCAFLAWEHSLLLAAILMIGFAIWEWWNDHEIMQCQTLCLKYNLELKYHNHEGYYIPEGAMDFWESTVTFLIGLVILAILEAKGIVVMTWL